MDHLYRSVADGGTRFEIREAEFRTGIAYALDCLSKSNKVAPTIKEMMWEVGKYLSEDFPTGDPEQDYQFLQYFLESWEGFNAH